MNHVTPSAGRAEGRWTSALVVHQHHHELGLGLGNDDTLGGIIVRAGRGTRQDMRWVEHVRAARERGLLLGSYWHVYPSRTDPYHQAELWGAARRVVDEPFPLGHWADVTSTDEFPDDDLRVYLQRFLRRADALLGCDVGVYASGGSLRGSVQHSLRFRPHWCPLGEHPRITTSGIELRRTTQTVPGLQRVRRPAEEPPPGHSALHLVARRSDETLAEWRARWISGPEIVALQEQLDEHGAHLVVDGAFGPQTDAAVRTWEALCRRDGIALDATGIDRNSQELRSPTWRLAA